MATVKKSKKGIIIAIIAVVVALAVAGTSIGIIAAKKKIPQVSLYTISTGDINEVVNSTGTVSSGTVKDFKVSSVATVKEVFVKVGDEVKAGDMLATFDTSGLDSQLSQLQLTYAQAKESYETAVINQKTAKTYLDEINPEIEELEKKVAELQEIVDYSTTSTTTTEPTTKPSTTKPSTTAISTTERSTESTTRKTYPANMAGAVEALTDLVASINEISGSVEETNELTRIVMSVIIQEIENGNLSSDAIADKVGEAVSKAISDSINVEIVEAAVRAVDWAAIGASFAQAPNVNLASAEVRLASLYAEKQLFEIEASQDTVNAKKQFMITSKNALDAVQEADEELTAGWVAPFDGTITSCDLVPGIQTNMLASGLSLQNLDEMVVTISLGEYDTHKVKVGMPVTITTAYGQYTGEVISKAPTATGGTSSSSALDSLGSMAGISGLSSLTATGAGVQTVISVNAPDDNIIAGFDADVVIGVGDNVGITVVPIESIVLEKTGSYVYIYNEEDSTVTKTQITTGAISDSYYQVLSGLQPGDKIVATPSSDFTEDTFEVKVK